MVSFSEALAAGKVTPEEANALFDSLPAVKPEEVSGLWKGSSFPTGSLQDGTLERSGWFGKRLTGPDAVDPLVFSTKDGSGHFAVDPIKAMGLIMQGLFLPDVQDQCETADPKARLRAVEYRGVSTASMVYNELPIIDHFRRVDADTLLGSMDNLQMPGPSFFFVLRRHT